MVCGDERAPPVLAKNRCDANHELPEALLGRRVLDRGDAVDDHERRLELLQAEPEIDEQIFEARRFGIAADHLQGAGLDRWFHRHADRAIVAQQDPTRLFEPVVDDTFAAEGAGPGVKPREQRLAAPGRAADDDDRVAQPAAVRHLVETLTPLG